MQSFGDFTLMKIMWRHFSKACGETTHIFQPRYAQDPQFIMESTKEYLLCFSNQISTVEAIKMEHVKDGFIPRKLNQWFKKATDLKCQVSDALKELQNSSKRQVSDVLKEQQNSAKELCLQYNELKDMCDKIKDKMKDCPIEDVDDKSIAFVGAPAPDPAPLPKLTSSKNMGGQTSPEGKSSRVLRDAVILEISPKEDDKKCKSKIIEQGVATHRTSSMLVEQKHGLRGKMQISVNDPNDDVVLQPKLRVLTSEKNPAELRVETSSSYSQESKHHDEYVRKPRQADDDICIPISLIGKMSEYVDVRLQLLNMSSSQATFINLNDIIGLHPEMDNYLLSAIKKPQVIMDGRGQQRSITHETISHNTNGALLPENLFVNLSGSSSREKPTDEEWHRAAVVNLIEKNVLLQNEELEPHCPNLVFLFLQRNRRLTHIPSSFFNQMPALRFLDLSDTRIKTLPSSLFKLTNLEVLLLRGCVCLDSLPAEVRNLINLKLLDLLGTDLSDLPKEIGKLKQLRYLQLSLYQPSNAHFQSELATYGALSKLQALQGLNIVVHPKDQHWMRIVGDIVKQVGELKMLSYLQFYFPSVEALKSFSDVCLSWKEQRLTRFKFLVGHNIKRIISRVPDQVESKYEQYDRCLRFMNGTKEVSQEMKSILKAVTAFYLDHHLEIQSLSEFDISNFKELKFCVLSECSNIQVMIIGEKRTEVDFPNLEYLGLHYLWKLERIWEDPVPTGSYQALKYLMVGTCGKLEYIASHSVLQCLSNLETFIIEDCESLKSIVKEIEMVKHDAPLLPRLKELVLRHLPQLVALGRGFFPSQDIISIHFCPELILRTCHSTIEWKKLLGSNICKLKF